MGSEVHKREYNVQDSVKFKLYNPAGTAGIPGVTWAAGDVKLTKDGGAEANATNTPTSLGNGWYSITLTATELSCKQLTVQIEDAESTWLETGFIVETYAHASSQFPDNDAAIADAVWDESLLGHKVVNSPGQIFNHLRLANALVANASNLQIDLGSLGLADDELNDCLIVIEDVSAGEYHSRWITDFVGSTSIADVDSALPFTTESGVDKYVVFGIRRNALGLAASERVTLKNDIAIEVLTRDLDTVEATAAKHSLTGMALKAVSRVVVDDTANTVTVYRTDGTTSFYVQNVTQAASINPIIEQAVAT